MRFKQWFNENLSGRGDGPTSAPIDQLSLQKDIMSKGSGAFPSWEDMPPKSTKTPTSGYVDSRFVGKRKRHKPI